MFFFVFCSDFSCIFSACAQKNDRKRFTCEIPFFLFFVQIFPAFSLTSLKNPIGNVSLGKQTFSFFYIPQDIVVHFLFGFSSFSERFPVSCHFPFAIFDFVLRLTPCQILDPFVLAEAIHHPGNLAHLVQAGTGIHRQHGPVKHKGSKQSKGNG